MCLIGCRMDIIVRSNDTWVCLQVCALIVWGSLTIFLIVYNINDHRRHYSKYIYMRMRLLHLWYSDTVLVGTRTQSMHACRDKRIVRGWWHEWHAGICTLHVPAANMFFTSFHEELWLIISQKYKHSFVEGCSLLYFFLSFCCSDIRGKICNFASSPACLVENGAICFRFTLFPSLFTISSVCPLAPSALPESSKVRKLELKQWLVVFNMAFVS